MFINFKSSEAVHADLLQEAFNSFAEKNKGFLKLIAMDGPVIGKSERLKVFSPFLSDIIDSIPLAKEAPTIILPDLSSTSITHLSNILTQGFTKICLPRSLQREVEKSIMEAAAVLNINLNNLVLEKDTTEPVINIKVELKSYDVENIKEENLY